VAAVQAGEQLEVPAARQVGGEAGRLDEPGHGVQGGCAVMGPGPPEPSSVPASGGISPSSIRRYALDPARPVKIVLGSNRCRPPDERHQVASATVGIRSVSVKPYPHSILSGHISYPDDGGSKAIDIGRLLPGRCWTPWTAEHRRRIQDAGVAVVRAAGRRPRTSLSFPSAQRPAAPAHDEEAVGRLAAHRSGDSTDHPGQVRGRRRGSFRPRS
jgi:hypothetical protein